MRRLVQSLGGQPWGLLGIVTGYGVLTPNAEALLIDSLKCRKEQVMCGCALVLEGTNVPSLARSQLARIYTKASIHHQFATSEDEGLAWLKALDCLRVG